SKYLDELNKKYSDATHICFAYSLSSPRLEKADDDGEPSGTAGKPILELIKKRNLENVLIAVVRYFGGIKLGAGGLVRAYTNASNLVIDKASIVEIVEIDKFQVVAEVSLGAKLSNLILGSGGKLLSTKYSDKVSIEYMGVSEEKIKLIFPEVEIKKIGSEVTYVRDNGSRSSEKR
ncbi:MAG: IMPACT family protein, partial [Christensenellales bacterium]